MQQQFLWYKTCLTPAITLLNSCAARGAPGLIFDTNSAAIESPYATGSHFAMPPRINIPPLTRGLLLLVLALTLLNSALTYRNIPLLDQTTVGLSFLSIVPRSSIKSPWVFGTAAFVEQNLFSLAASMLTIYYGGRYLERAWGGPEYAKFVLFVIMIPNVLSFVVYWMWYGITGSETRLYVHYLILSCRQTY